MTNISTFEPTYFTTKAVELNELVPHLMRFGLIMLTAGIIFIGLYAFVPAFRNWVKACCFINNPKKFWDKKGYQLPTFERVDPNRIYEEVNPTPDTKLIAPVNNDTNTSTNTNNDANTNCDANNDTDINNDANTPGAIYAVPERRHKRNDSLVYGPEQPFARSKLFSKKRMDQVMAQEMEDYKDRILKKKDREMERELQVLQKRVECENITQVRRDEQGRLMPTRKAPKPPTTTIFTEHTYANAHPINNLHFNNDIPLPPPPPPGIDIKQRATELGRQLRFREHPN